MQLPRRLILIGAICAVGVLAVAAAPSDDIPAAIRAAVDAKDRSPEDRALDAGRHPAQMLAFFGIRPGMRVAELGAGGGYTTELLVRVVGPEGRVWGQNTPFLLERVAAKPWAERLAKPVMKNVVRLDRSFDDPFPPEVKDLDAVLIVLLYHDTVWMKVDRARMNRAVFAALKSGGVYGIVDHSAKPAMQGVVRLDRDFDDPFPPDVRDLDAVLIILLYHDTVWMKVDRERMNRAVYAALKPGGVYGIVDHSARIGTGLADVESLHRIDESKLRSEVEAAGFRLAADGDFLHNPQDTRDWSPSPRVAGERRGTSDRFVLRFVKP